MGRVIKRGVVSEENLLQNIEGQSDINTGKSKEITERILQLMNARKWNQKEFAENLQKSEAEVSKLLSGYHNFTLRTIEKFEAVLGGDVIVVPVKTRIEAKVVPMPQFMEDEEAINTASEYDNAIPVKEWRKEYKVK